MFGVCSFLESTHSDSSRRIFLLRKAYSLTHVKTRNLAMTSFSFAVTSCFDRMQSGALNETVQQLNKAAFPTNQLVRSVDGVDGEPYGMYGNWILTAWELWLRNPKSDFYCIFQDDIICCKNLKPYLQATLSPHANCYFNLYCGRSNTEHVKDSSQTPGWYSSNQMGRGALGLVFTRPAFMQLLSSQEIVGHPQEPEGTRGIDKTICLASRRLGIIEKVHYPSLIQHRDEGDVPSTRRPQPGRISPCFVGDEFDAMELLRR